MVLGSNLALGQENLVLKKMEFSGLWIGALHTTTSQLFNIQDNSALFLHSESSMVSLAKVCPQLILRARTPLECSSWK